MRSPFAKTTPTLEKYEKFLQVADGGDILAVVVNADPDALASAMALKRLFWRRVKPIQIFRINRIERADNLAMVNLLDIGSRHVF